MQRTSHLPRLHQPDVPAGVDVIASVYRVGRLDTALNRFKVDVNAKENHLSGEDWVCLDLCCCCCAVPVYQWQGSNAALRSCASDCQSWVLWWCMSCGCRCCSRYT
jgi:hypothetical protein